MTGVKGPQFKSQRLSLIVPCFNEALNIKLFLNRIKELRKSKPDVSLELIVVDGGSTDGSQENLKKEFEGLDSKDSKVFLMQERGGYGKDIVHGLSMAEGDVLAWTHADMQTDPLDVYTAYELFKKEHSPKRGVVVKGKRENRSILDTFFTFGMQVVTFFILHVWLDDINAQPKVFSKNFFKEEIEGQAPDDFSLDLFALYQARKNGLDILTTPVVFADRIHGEAKGGGGSWKMRISLIRRTLKYIRKISRELKA